MSSIDKGPCMAITRFTFSSCVGMIYCITLRRQTLTYYVNLIWCSSNCVGMISSVARSRQNIMVGVPPCCGETIVGMTIVSMFSRIAGLLLHEDLP